MERIVCRKVSFEVLKQLSRDPDELICIRYGTLRFET